MSNPFCIPTPALISFSGGRTSAMMLRKIIDAFGGSLPYDVFVTFCNTGREIEETLVFVRECGLNWLVPIHWLEYRRTTHATVEYQGKRAIVGCHGFREVNFVTAFRHGEPFAELIDVLRDYRAEVKNADAVLPNPTQRFCTAELKRRTMERFMKSKGYGEFTTVVGLRADEPKRVKALEASGTRAIEYVCPLAEAGIIEADVLAFWRSQSFDLGLRHDAELGTYEGNCDLCFLKRSAKIKRLISERPVEAEWWAEQEQRTGQTFRKDRPSIKNLISDSKISLFDSDLGNCLCTD